MSLRMCPKVRHCSSVPYKSLVSSMTLPGRQKYGTHAVTLPAYLFILANESYPHRFPFYVPHDIYGQGS